jgi:NDP-sugar pyrophosphorylase family protein
MSAPETETRLPTIAILCGGLATRLRPVTLTVPKSMLQVAGEPFIAHQLRLLVKAGFQNVVLLCGYLGDQIQSFVQDGRQFGCEVRFSFDGPDLLGTGGAVRRALPLLGRDFMLTYGDSYCPTDYFRIYEAFRASLKPGLMTIFHNENRWDTSNVDYRDQRIARYDKTARDASMEYIDYGVSAFKAEVFEEDESGQALDLSSIQKNLVARGQLAGLEVFERFYEIGKARGLEAADSELRGILDVAKAHNPAQEETNH